LDCAIQKIQLFLHNQVGHQNFTRGLWKLSTNFCLWTAQSRKVKLILLYLWGAEGKYVGVGRNIPFFFVGNTKYGPLSSN